MRIAMFYYAETGTNAHGKCDLQLMRALADTHEITVFSARLDNPDPDRIRFVRVPLPHVPLFAVLVIFWVWAPIVYAWHRLRTGVRFDLVHYHDVDLPFGDVAYVHFCNRAYLERVGAPRPWAGPRALARWLEHRLRAAAERSSFRRVPHIVVPSRGLQDELAEHFGPAVAAKTTVIPNFVPLDALSPPSDVDRGEVRRAHGFAPDDLVAVFCALGHHDRKGLPALYDALVEADDPAVKLLVCGGTPSTVQSLRSRADELGIGNRVVVLETRADVRPELWAADLFVLPSAYETFSLVAYEAAAAGLPLVVTPVHGVVDILDDGVNGCLVGTDAASVAKALRWSAEHRDELAGMGRRARVSVAAFSPEGFSERWRAYYRDRLEVDRAR